MNFDCFSTVKADVSVKIAGTTCDVGTVSDTTITCTTNQHAKSEKVNVEVEVAGNGIAKQVCEDGKNLKEIRKSDKETGI